MNNELRTVAKKLRLATMLAKIAPFVYAAFYTICLLTYLFGGDVALFYVDALFYVSPLMVAFIYALGVVFECCKWHRLQCVVLLLPTLASFLDVWFDLSAVAIWVNIGMLVIVLASSLLNAYKMFVCDGTRDE